MNSITKWIQARLSKSSVEGICDRVIRFSFALLFILVPIILTPWNYELFEFNKMMLTYALTAVIGGAWIIKMLAKGEVRIAKTPLDLPIVLFFTSQLVSTIFSIDPLMSWFGNYSRFNGGMWSVICYVLLYYAFVSNYGEAIRDTQHVIRKTSASDISRVTYHISRLLKLSLLSATLVALYGVLERLGIDKNLWVQDVQTRVFSTLGQPNWLAAYLVALLPVAMAFALSSLRAFRPEEERAAISKKGNQIASSMTPCNDTMRAIFWLGAFLLFFIVLLFTRSRSGLLGFAIADVVFWG